MNIKNAEWKDGIYKADQESGIEVYPLWTDKMKNVLTDGNEYTGNVYVSFDGLCYDGIVSKIYIVQTQINTQDTGYVFFSIPYSQNWRAFYNGKKVEVVKADYGFTVVEVKSGNGEIELKYHSVWLEVGRWMMFISCLIIFLLYRMEWPERRKG